MPDLCLEVKQGEVVHTLLNADETINLNCVIDCKNFSRLSTLLRLTAYVIRFIRVLKSKIREGTLVSSELNAGNIAEAESLWVREVQSFLMKSEHFDMWK